MNRRHLVTLSAMAALGLAALPTGTVLSRADLALKRPGDGLAPARLPELIGRRLVRDMRADDAIRAEDVAP